MKTNRAVLPLAVLAVLAAGCGTQHAGDGTGAAPQGAAAAPATAAPSATADHPCPGESPSPAAPAAASTGPAAAPTDHYAENHGFMEPFPLHGDRRCAGLATVRRVEAALEPLRRRGDFAPASTARALGRLGFPAGSVWAGENGPTGVSFLISTYPVCVQGTMDRAQTSANAFGGYPDHPACDQPRGGH
jgi:hypothetical protein